MLIDDDDDDPIAEIGRLDRFYDGEEDGERPLEVLRARGVELPEESSLDDEALHQKLTELFDEMAGIGMLLDSTNHLSDRELYRYLLTDALLEETILPRSSAGAWHMSPIGGGGQRANATYSGHYAADETRDGGPPELCHPPAPKERPP